MNQENAALSPMEEREPYNNILVALDSSDHANRGLVEAVKLASLCNAKITGTHVYAAKLHDVRFRQMEGGLPEQFREEQELERQREVHDDLITRGLSIITESYLDQAEKRCVAEDVELKRCSLEGKNYRALVNEANGGGHDLLVIGALGLGSIPGTRLGTVCCRAVRRSSIDTVVIKDPLRSLAEGPIVVAIDGSPRSYGGLRTALLLAKSWDVPIHVIAAFDPYYHYVAFNRIAGVLSEEASKVFRFKEQEKLHEEIIDSGLAKIYDGHLAVAQSIADEHGVDIHTELLAGKAHDAVERYVRKVDPSFLIIGKLGVHADSELDIGGNAENLLRNVDCSVLLSQREHQPRVDVLATANTSWTHEAEQRLAKAPDFVQNMARVAILRYAQEQGHTVVTERLVEEATAQLMPSRAEDMMRDIVDAFGDRSMPWDDTAKTLLETIADDSLRDNVSLRAEKRARADSAQIVGPQHIMAFIDEASGDSASESAAAESSLHWQAAALARLMRAPQGFMRDLSKKRVEKYARANGMSEIDLDAVEAGLNAARAAMEEQLGAEGKTKLATSGKTGKCPFAGFGTSTPATEATADAGQLEWSDEARRELQAVPAGYCRDMTVSAAETIASQKGLDRIDTAFIKTIMRTFAAGSKTVEETLPWDEAARLRIFKAPPLVRGMLQKEIEGWAQRSSMNRVTEAAVDAVRQQWAERGVFHLDPDDPRNTAGDANPDQRQ
jgi:nucleotide-binding universal stress UspA family protein